MKKILLAIILCVSVYAHAQTNVYHPFPDSSARWCGSNQWYDGFCDHTNNYSISIRGDTLINGNVYHLLEKSWFTYSTQCGGGTTGYLPTCIVIRQDTLLHKVFIYDSSINGDTIFYNFNLQIGDTLDRRKVIWGNYPGSCIITSIDSIMINGQYRNRYNFYDAATGGCADSSIIEGIGSISGLCSGPSSCFEYFASLTLFRQNGQILYPSDTNFLPPMSYMCPDYSLQEVAEINPQAFHINPNPATNQLTIDNAKWKIKLVEIYSVLGEKIVNYPLSTVNSQLTINVSELPAGVYFVRARSENRVATGKFAVVK